MSKTPIEPVYQAIAARIRMLRNMLDISQDDFAKRVGLERTSVTNIEAGRQRFLVDDVEKFAAALGTSPKNLLKGVWW